MRAIAVLFVFLWSTCALAQDPVPAPSLASPQMQLFPWSLRPAPPVRELARIELAGQPPPVCAVKLQEMSIPKDIHFTMKAVKPPKVDAGIFVKVPAPACP